MQSVLSNNRCPSEWTTIISFSAANIRISFFLRKENGGKLRFWCKILTGRADGGAETLYIKTRKSPGGFPGLVWLFVCFVSCINKSRDNPQNSREAEYAGKPRLVEV